MKYLKTLGLAAIAAMALMAFVGAGTASATTLNNGTETLKTGSAIASSLITGTSADLKDTTGATIATCTGSSVSGKTTNETGEKVNGNIESLTWTGCSQTTDTLANGTLSIKRTGENEGEVSGAGSKVTLGIFGVSCVYGTGEGTKLGTAKGGTPAVLKVNAVIPKIEGGILCPSTGVWKAEYEVTTPATLNIVP